LVEVKQEEKEIFISKEAYAKFILKKFNLKKSNAISILVDYGINLSRYDERSVEDLSPIK